MTFVFDTVLFESFFLYLENTTPTAPPSRSSHRMMVTSRVSSQHKKISGPTSKTECEETDEDKGLIPKKGNTTLLIWK